MQPFHHLRLARRVSIFSFRAYATGWEKHSEFRENYQWPPGLGPSRQRPIAPQRDSVEWKKQLESQLIRDRDIEVPDSSLAQQLYPTEKADPGTNPRVLKVALVGPVNAGKSTLLNSLLSEKVSRVSKLAQTTTDTVAGILNRGNTQVVIYDTPGLPHHRKIRSLPTAMHEWSIIPKVDLVVAVFDSSRAALGETDEEVLNRLPTVLQACDPSPEVIAVLSKRSAEIGEIVMESGIFSWFCRTGKTSRASITALQDYLLGRAKPGPWLYDATKKTTKTNKERVIDIVQEKIYRYTQEEIPYMTKVNLVGWRNTRLGAILIVVELYAPSKGAQAKLIGTNGSVAKGISTAASEALLKLWQVPVSVQITVKWNAAINNKKLYAEEQSKKNYQESFQLPE